MKGKEKGKGMLLIGIGPAKKKGEKGMDDSGEYSDDEDMREAKVAAADALKAALEADDKEAMVDALDAFMDCR